MRRRDAITGAEKQLISLYDSVEELWNKLTSIRSDFSKLESLVNKISSIALSDKDVVKRILSTDSPYQMVKGFNIIVANTDDGDIAITPTSGLQSDFIKISNAGESGNVVTVSGTIYGESGITLHDKENVELHYDATEGWF